MRQRRPADLIERQMHRASLRAGDGDTTPARGGKPSISFSVEAASERVVGHGHHAVSAGLVTRKNATGVTDKNACANNL